MGASVPSLPPYSMMFISVRDALSPTAGATAASRAFWRALGMATGRPWFSAWFSMGFGADERVEHTCAFTEVDLVARIRAFPHDRLIKANCVFPKDGLGNWSSRSIAAIWRSPPSLHQQILFEDLDGELFCTKDGWLDPVPLAQDHSARSLIVRAGSQPGRAVRPQVRPFNTQLLRPNQRLSR